MIVDTFLANIEKSLPFELTEAQREATKRLCAFIFNPRPYTAYILRGYAGTGKTTVTAAIIKQLHKLKRNTVLLAPTGRAAKVLAQHSGYPAFTIHKEIYRQKQVGDINSTFTLDINKHKNAVFFVDEASMISCACDSLSPFGSGQILDDLITYVYEGAGAGCCIVFIGDNAQLPPVGELESPALSVARLKTMGLEATGFQLATVMRQAAQSGILHNATSIRRSIAAGDTTTPPMVDFSQFNDIRNVRGGELVEHLESDYSRLGTDNVVVITRSNKQAVKYNIGIRSMIFGREESLTIGDAVMIVRNNYYWTEQYAANSQRNGDAAPPVNFLANGDIAIVTHIDSHLDLYGLHFADITLQFPDYDDFEMDVRVLLDALTSESPSLTKEQNDMLYSGVTEDYADITNKKERIKKMRLDPNLNAVQIKYAYAVTCHKAQGGQWSSVYIDQGWLPPDGIDLPYYRWLYTAFTRATDQLSLVNWPEQQSC